MTKLNIYLVRHGQTFYNRYNKLQGWSNSPLTTTGQEQAVRVGQRLKEIHFDAAFTSDLSRAVETAKLILGQNDADSVTQPKTLPELREEFYGSYEGENMSWAWEMAGLPHGLKTFKEIVTTHSIDTAKDWLKDADPFRDAEDHQEYWARLEQGLAKIRQADLPAEANVLWVSHGNTCLSLVERFGAGKYDITERPKNGSLSRLILTDDDLKFVSYNE